MTTSNLSMNLAPSTILGNRLRPSSWRPHRGRLRSDVHELARQPTPASPRLGLGGDQCAGILKVVARPSTRAGKADAPPVGPRRPKFDTSDVLWTLGGLAIMSAFWMGVLAGSASTIIGALFLWWAALRLLPTLLDLLETFNDRRQR